MDGDDLLISATRARAKERVAERTGRMSVCVVGEEMPFSYVTVYGPACIEDAGAVELMMKIGQRMSGNPVPEAARPALEKRARDQGRVVLRIKPDGHAP
jgi:hypothetical protein